MSLSHGEQKWRYSGAHRDPHCTPWPNFSFPLSPDKPFNLKALNSGRCYLGQNLSSLSLSIRICTMIIRNYYITYLIRWSNTYDVMCLDCRELCLFCAVRTEEEWARIMTVMMMMMAITSFISLSPLLYTTKL